MADQLQLRGGTTAEHATFTGALREVTVDTDKDTIVVHDNATAGGRPLLREDLSNLPAGTIDNADINVSAAIAGTKVAPDFGSQNITTTGVFSHALGAVGTPSITFTGDLNTGFWSPAADTLAASTGGSERLRIDSSGRLGLGTSAPGLNLEIQAAAGNSTNAAIRLRANDSGGGSGSVADITAIGTGSQASALTFSTRDGTNILERLRITSGGLVGIGSTDVQSKLDVRDDNEFGIITIRRATSPTVNMGLGINSAQTESVINYQTSAGLKFTQSGSEKARLDGSGRLLIGTSNSVNVGSTVAAYQQITHSASAMSLAVWRQGGTGTVVIGGTSSENTGAVASNTTFGEIRFAGGDSTDLQTVGAAISAAADGSAWTTDDAPTRLVFSTTADGASSPTERMRIQSNGDILINRTTAEASGSSLQVIGTPAASFEIGVNGNNVVEFRNSGGASVIGSISINVGGTATAFNTSSDYRLKENVVDLDGAIDRLKQLRVRRFNFIADPDTVVDGFIAHEAATVVPEAITGTKDAVDADGNPVYQGIDQSKLVPLLTAALQEAIGRIKTLEAEVAALKAS
jgi:hypothetical protein